MDIHRESAVRLPVITKWNVGSYVKDGDLLPHFVTKYLSPTGKVLPFISTLQKSRVRVLQDCIDRRMIEAFPDAYKQWSPGEFAKTGPLKTSSKKQFPKTFCKLLWAKIYLHNNEISFENRGMLHFRARCKQETRSGGMRSLERAGRPSHEHEGPSALPSPAVKLEQAGRSKINRSVDPAAPSSPSPQQRGRSNLSSLRARHERAGGRGPSNRSLDEGAARSESPEHIGRSDLSSVRVPQNEQNTRRRSRNVKPSEEDGAEEQRHPQRRRLDPSQGVISSEEDGAEEQRQPQRRRLDASPRVLTNAFVQLTCALRSVFTTASARLTHTLRSVELRRWDIEPTEEMNSGSGDLGDVRAEMKGQVVKLNVELAKLQEKVGTLESKVESLEEIVSQQTEFDETANNLRAEAASAELHLRKRIQELKEENARLKRGQFRGRNSTAKCEEPVHDRRAVTRAQFLRDSAAVGIDIC